MKNFTTKLTNEVMQAKWNRVKHTHTPNRTLNSVLSPTIFKRECAEYDAGVLQVEHDLYLGERCV